MANYWAIAIGINQYRCFQPLLYAQRDARELWNYWVSEGRFAPEHCLLLTDGLDADQSIPYPSRDTLASAIVQMCQQLQPDDVLWCFFSGYGVHFQGKDYLMPEEGNPTQVLETGIPLESVFTTLKAAPTNKIMLILDANRSQGALDVNGFGQETIALATQ